MTKKHKVVIEGGATEEENKIYYFDTKEEKEIFARGVDVAIEWLGYKVKIIDERAV